MFNIKMEDTMCEWTKCILHSNPWEHTTFRPLGFTNSFVCNQNGKLFKLFNCLNMFQFKYLDRLKTKQIDIVNI